MDPKQRANELLERFERCMLSRPLHGAVDIQLEKDSVAKWAYHLSTQRSWGTDNEIAEACHQLESRLELLEKKLIIEIITNGTV